MNAQQSNDEPPDTTTLLRAVNEDDAATIERVVRSGVSPDSRDAWGEPVLLLAARLEKVRALRQLLVSGADGTLRGPEGATLLHFVACYPSTLAWVEAVVTGGAEVDARDNRGTTPLMLALARGHVAGARALLAHGADPFARDADGATTVFHFVNGVYAFRPGESHAAQLGLLAELLELGVDPAAKGPAGRTALAVAAGKGLRDVVAALDRASGRAGDAARRDALLTALREGQLETARRLLDAGMPQDLYSAAALGRLEDVRIQLREQPQQLDAPPPAPGLTALSLAIRYGHADVARELLERGADARGADAWTSSLHNAARHLPEARVLAMLLEHGADPGAIDGDGNTPLNLAVRAGRSDLARLLLEAGADPNARTDRGVPLLQFCRDDDMRALLLRHGARA